MNTNSAQMITGKSFEYALLKEFYEKLKSVTNIEIINNSSFEIAKECFNKLSNCEKSRYLLTSSFAVNFLIDIEPRLSNGIDKSDVLQLEIFSDFRGKSGDVRDVLAIRVLQKWEIGVSAKNNHKAVKHSRLSSDIDFGEKWLGICVSQRYFDTVRPIFEKLREIRTLSNKKKKWNEIGNYHETVYMPILDAFITELKRIYEIDNKKVAQNLISYLIGTKDFYKVIQSKNTVEIHAYNMHGTLNLPFENIEPKYMTPIVSFPTKINSIKLKNDSNTTVIVEFNNDWALSFRIHNASSRVEPSLKFDINLLNSPKSLFKNILNIK